MDSMRAARGLAICTLVVLAVFGTGLVHELPAHDGHGEHHRDGTTSKVEHCVVCAAVCLGGLGAVLASIGLVGRPRHRGRRLRSRRVPALLWAWVLDRPPQTAAV